MTWRSSRPSRANPAIIPACVEPVTVHTTTWSKNTPSSASWAATSRAQLANPSPPSGWSDAPAGIAYGLPPAATHRVQRPLPAVADADVEAGGVEPDVAAHDAGQLDVADPARRRVGPVDPVLLHGHGAEPEVAGDAGDGAGVVGLHAADRDERVAALGERLGDEVLELAHLVAAERDAGVAVLPLGPDLDPAAELGAQPRQRVHRRGPEQQRDAGEVVEGIAAS